MAAEQPPRPAPTVDRATVVAHVRALAHPLRAGDLSSYDPLLDRIGDARIVLIGDASHGTHQFYRERALITTRLIEEKGFSMLALEADWPEGRHLDRSVQSGAGSAAEALEVFAHYPTWMWGNHDFLHFVAWLQRHNRSAERPVRVFGIDVRNLWDSVQLLLAYLDATDPALAAEARAHTPAFERFSAGLRNAYQHRADAGITGRVATQARALYDLVTRHRDQLRARSGEEAYHHALQAASVILNGERFYGAVYEQDRDTSWNIRDTHMMDTLDRLLALYPATKVVIWQHNSHIGDYRATSDGPVKLNIGRLVRERHPGASVAVGFATWGGTVTATREWGERPQQMPVPDADPESYEGIFHEAGLERFLLLLTSPAGTADPDGLDEWRGHRAIGVVYHPEDEAENFVPTRLRSRYDAVVFIDRTTAIQPLRDEPTWEQPGDMHTYPSGY